MTHYTNTPLTNKEDNEVNAIGQVLPNAIGAEVLSLYAFNVASGDVVITGSGAAGRKWTTVSIDPLTSGKITRISSKRAVKAPLRVFAEPSVSARYRGDYSVVYLADTSKTVPTNVTFPITALSQTTTTLTITLSTAFTGRIGSWVAISGASDNRLNYFNLCIATVSADGRTLTATTFDETTLPSISATATSATLTLIEPFGGADNALGMRTSGTTATSNAVLSRYGAEYFYATGGTPAASQVVTTGSTALLQTVTGATGQYSFQATSRYALELTARAANLLDKGINSSSTPFTMRQHFTDVKPDDKKEYQLVFDVVTPISQPIPVAKIVSASKTGTTTATITTDVPHGLTTSSYVQTYGICDVTNFPNLTTATVVSSVIDATRFTIAIAGAVTATSYGGAVTLCNGSQTQQGLIGQTLQTVARDAAGFVALTSGSSWSGMIVGGTVQLHGCRDKVSGADLLVDGAYRVNTINTTTLILEPLYDYLGNNVSPSGGVINTTSCGGAVIDRVEYRLHDVGFENFNDSIVQIDGQGTNDVSRALPVNVVFGGLSAAQGTAAAVSTTDGSGGWFVRPSTTAITDITSAAIISTTTVSSISNSLGSAFQVTIPVTSVSGTNPTMDVRIEHSFDGGTNWFTLYDFQRIIATGNYNSPLLRSTARHIRYVQTIGGTSPSFTRAITRNIWPMHNVEPMFRMVDRSITLTTLNSVTPTLFCPEANNTQLVINLGAVTTTAPALQLEGSEDGSNWYALGTPLTGVASSTVEVTVNAKSPLFVRARVSTAGVGVTAGYVSIKAWS